MDDFVPPLVLLHVLPLVLHSNWVFQILAAEHFVDETSQAHVPFHLLTWNRLLTINHSVRWVEASGESRRVDIFGVHWHMAQFNHFNVVLGEIILVRFRRLVNLSYKISLWVDLDRLSATVGEVLGVLGLCVGNQIPVLCCLVDCFHVWVDKRVNPVFDAPHVWRMTQLFELIEVCPRELALRFHRQMTDKVLLTTVSRTCIQLSNLLRLNGVPRVKMFSLIRVYLTDELDNLTGCVNF